MLIDLPYVSILVPRLQVHFIDALPQSSALGNNSDEKMVKPKNTRMEEPKPIQSSPIASMCNEDGPQQPTAFLIAAVSTR